MLLACARIILNFRLGIVLHRKKRTMKSAVDIQSRRILESKSTGESVKCNYSLRLVEGKNIIHLPEVEMGQRLLNKRLTNAGTECLCPGVRGTSLYQGLTVSTENGRANRK